MRINHNAAAVNTYSKLSSAQGAQAKSLEKLSSGLRINRAGDDAAGLAISEKMRGQISGLNQASRNAQDGISLIQTAEGGLNETHSILQRMRELAVQSANDTNTDDDRVEIQKEMNQLSQEVSRISGDTQFNGKELLDGKFDAKFHIGANAGQSMSLSVSDMSAKALSVEGKIYDETTIAAGLNVRGVEGTKIETIKFADAQTGPTGNEFGVPETTASLSDDGKTVTITLKQAAYAAAADGAITANHGEVKAALDSIASKAGIIVETNEETYVATADATVAADITLETGVDSSYSGSVSVGINVSTQTKADEAITIIDEAIKSVSAERSKLGSVQNRLDHTINNLTATSENLSAAESRIRDVDMAKEMMEFTKNNILNQASTAMLAQANQMPQGVLQLLG